MENPRFLVKPVLVMILLLILMIRIQRNKCTSARHGKSWENDLYLIRNVWVCGVCEKIVKFLCVKRVCDKD